MPSNSIDHRRGSFSGRRALAMGVLAVGLVACKTETLVDLRNPDLITGGIARDPANIDQLYNGVLFEFGRAVSGAAATNDNPGLVGISGVLADEMWYASSFNTMQDIDRRNITDVSNSDLTLLFQRIHRARNLADRAFEQLNAIGEGSTARAAEM